MFNGSMFIKNVTAMVLMGQNFQPMRDHNWLGQSQTKRKNKIIFSDVSIDLDTWKWKNTRFFEYVKELW